MLLGKFAEHALDQFHQPTIPQIHVYLSVLYTPTIPHRNVRVTEPVVANADRLCAVLVLVVLA